MQKKIAATLAALLSVGAVSAAQAQQRPWEFTVGGEYYRETYREYTNGTERFMQERGNLWSLNGGIKYSFNERHAAKLEGRYSRGEADYTGGFNPSPTSDGTPYGSVHEPDIVRRAYDVRALYEYKQPLNDRLDLVLEAGLGHRTLKDLGQRKNPNAADRKNQILYARVGAGLDVKLPHSFEINPKVSYNHMLRGRQYTERPGRSITHKQSGGYGIEVDLPVSKRLANDSKISVGPFYRGWKVPDSNRVYYMWGGSEWSSKEPKNYTHEAGVKLQYSF